MKRIFVKIVIALAIGLYMGNLAGNEEEIYMYHYVVDGVELEVSLYADIESDLYDYRLYHDYVFNKRAFIDTSVNITTALILLLLIPELFPGFIPRIKSFFKKRAAATKDNFKKTMGYHKENDK